MGITLCGHLVGTCGGGGADWTQISKEFKFLIAFLFHEGKKIELRL